MIGRWRRTTAVVVAAAALAACGADRDAPVAARPVPATTTEPATTAARRTTTTNNNTTTTTTTERRVPRSTTTSKPSTTTTTQETAVTATEPPPSSSGAGGGGAPSTTSSTPPVAPTTAAATTTTVAARSTTPPEDPAWGVFDFELAARLIGRGDYAASVVVAVDGEIVHQRAYGVRVPPVPAPLTDPLAPPPVPGQEPAPTELAPPTTSLPAVPLEQAEPGDRFRIGSISKLITAIVVLQLVEAGQLGLDEPVGARLAQQVSALPVDPGVSAITVRHLLSHTAGFPSYQRTFFGGDVDSCPTVANLGLSRALRQPPGGSYEYSNLNYCLLGLLVEQVTARPYQDVVQERLLGPLGITGMRMAGTFDVGDSEVVHPSIPGRNYMEVLGAAGSWVATPADLVKIVDSLDLSRQGFHPLTAPTVELMRQPAPPPVVYRPDRWYGLGLIVHVDGAWGHTGTVENAHSMVLRRPDGVTWSVLVNGETPGNSDDLRRIFDEAIYASGVVL